MPASRPFLTVRRLTIATAIFALPALTALEIRRRGDVFHARAIRYGRLERDPNHGYMAFTHERNQKFPLLRAHYAGLRKKYELAGRRPWLPVTADPPEPR